MLFWTVHYGEREIRSEGEVGKERRRAGGRMAAKTSSDDNSEKR